MVMADDGMLAIKDGPCPTGTAVGTLEIVTVTANDNGVTDTKAVLGIEAMTEFGTESGTADQETITSDGEEWIVITADAGKDETQLAATTTGLDHEVGTATLAGTKTNELTATETTFDEGTDWITLVGTDSGILDQETIATEGEETAITTCVAGNDETHETGTACGLDHVVGIVTLSGTTANELTATVQTWELGIETIKLSGTLSGTFE
jgi:hypothetical protein